jgi:hypothetical protein
MSNTPHTHDGDETEQSDEDGEREAPLAELAYTTARQVLRGADEVLRLEELLIEPPESEGKPWTVLRSRFGGEMLTEADVFYPHRFKTAQGLAQYLAALAAADEDDWPAWVTGIGEESS